MDKNVEFEFDLRCWMFGVMWDDKMVGIAFGPITMGIKRHA
jgi:hypothetical protein